MEYQVYIIHSEVTKKYYTGHTEDLERRLKEHNSGKSRSTESGRPWKVIYTKSFATRREAMIHEQTIKNRGAGRFLEKIKT